VCALVIVVAIIFKFQMIFSRKTIESLRNLIEILLFDVWRTLPRRSRTRGALVIVIGYMTLSRKAMESLGSLVDILVAVQRIFVASKPEVVRN
jgi:hypothetical protein